MEAVPVLPVLIQDPILERSECHIWKRGYVSNLIAQLKCICLTVTIDLCNEVMLASFDDVDVEQPDRYIMVTCESYIDKLLAHYGWSAAGTRNTNSKPIKPLASSTLQQMFAEYETTPLNGSPEHALVEIAAVSPTTVRWEPSSMLMWSRDPISAMPSPLWPDSLTGQPKS